MSTSKDMTTGFGLNVTVSGLKELHAVLQQVPEKFARNVARGALNKAGMVYKKAAQANLKSNNNIRTGALRKNIKVSTRLLQQKPTGKVAVKQWYGHFIEGGTQPHEIKAVNVEFLPIGGGKFFRSVQHPGIKAQPFLRPAFDQHTKRAVIAAADYIRLRLEKGGYETPDPTWKDDE